VTCGGLCPGLSDVIRGLTMELCRRFGVHHVYGFCNGYEGFIARLRRQVLDLTPEIVSDINEHGGTILGSSRGEQDPAAVVDCLERMGINVLFVIGGDGTIRGAMAFDVGSNAWLRRQLLARPRSTGISLVRAPPARTRRLCYDLDPLKWALHPGAKYRGAAHRR
jgi:hypothetical protein